MLSDAEKREIRKEWIRRRQEKQEKEEHLREEALQRAILIARFLKDKYGVEKTYLFGSLAREGPFDHLSDIDLFVIGWKEEDKYWSMYTEVEEIARPFPISVVTERGALPSLVETIYREGRVLE